MRFRPALTMAALIAAIPLVPAAAQAAVTKNPKRATHVLPCNDGSGKTARVWYVGRASAAKTWAADNPCKERWLILDMPGDSQSDPYGAALSVAPGAHFQNHQMMQADGDEAMSAYLSSTRFDGSDDCPVGYALAEVRQKNHGRITWIKSCPDADDLGWFDEQ